MADDRDSSDALAASCELLSGTPEYTTDWLGYGLQSSSSEYPPHHTHAVRSHTTSQDTDSNRTLQTSASSGPAPPPMDIVGDDQIRPVALPTAGSSLPALAAARVAQVLTRHAQTPARHFEHSTIVAEALLHMEYTPSQVAELLSTLPNEDALIQYALEAGALILSADAQLVPQHRLSDTSALRLTELARDIPGWSEPDFPLPEASLPPAAAPGSKSPASVDHMPLPPESGRSPCQTRPPAMKIAAVTNAALRGTGSSGPDFPLPEASDPPAAAPNAKSPASADHMPLRSEPPQRTCLMRAAASAAGPTDTSNFGNSAYCISSGRCTPSPAAALSSHHVSSSDSPAGIALHSLTPSPPPPGQLPGSAQGLGGQDVISQDADSIAASLFGSDARIVDAAAQLISICAVIGEDHWPVLQVLQRVLLSSPSTDFNFIAQQASHSVFQAGNQFTLQQHVQQHLRSVIARTTPCSGCYPGPHAPLSGFAVRRPPPPPVEMHNSADFAHGCSTGYYTQHAPYPHLQPTPPAGIMHRVPDFDGITHSRGDDGYNGHRRGSTVNSAGASGPPDIRGLQHWHSYNSPHLQHYLAPIHPPPSPISSSDLNNVCARFSALGENPAIIQQQILLLKLEVPLFFISEPPRRAAQLSNAVPVLTQGDWHGLLRCAPHTRDALRSLILDSNSGRDTLFAFSDLAASYSTSPYGTRRPMMLRELGRMLVGQILNGVSNVGAFDKVRSVLVSSALQSKALAGQHALIQNELAINSYNSRQIDQSICNIFRRLDDALLHHHQKQQAQAWNRLAVEPGKTVLVDLFDTVLSEGNLRFAALPQRDRDRRIMEKFDDILSSASKDSRITVSFINGFMDKFQPTSVVNPNELLSAMRDSMQYGTSVVPRRTDVSVLSDACTDDEEAYLNSELP